MRASIQRKNRGEENIRDLRELTVFAEAARCGSFTEAAARLGTSTASISRAIARLEKEIGVRLFNRTTRRLSLTDEGQTYLVEVTVCLDRLEHAHERLKGFQDRAAGPVRALIQEAFCKNYVMRDLAGFLSRYPEIDLEIHLQEYGGDPLLGGYDVSVQSDEPRNNSYIVKKFGKVPIILAASPEYLALRGVPCTPDDLDAHECIRLGNTLEGALTWQLALRGQPDRPAVAYQPQGRCFFSGQFDAVIFAAASGVGIAPIDVGAARKYLEAGQLKIVLPDYELVGIELFLIYPHRERLPMRTRVFIDFIADVAARRLSPPEFDPLAYAA